MIQSAYIGTYAGKILSVEINTETMKFGNPVVLAELDAPSYCLVIGKYLIVCSEVTEFLGKTGGGIVSYLIKENGSLSELSRVNACGTVTCHIEYNPIERLVAVSNYGDGSFAISKLDENGILAEPHIIINHTGSGPDKSRQEGPHGHCCKFTQNNNTMFACDLGIDAAVEYKLESDKAVEVRRLRVPSGSGARHIAIDASGRYAYILCEMKSLIAAFDLSRTGDINPDSITSLIGEQDGPTGAAAIKYRDGYLLATNRFIDNISLYRADGIRLDLCDRVKCGQIPRDASFVPGAPLIVAGFQDDSKSVLYEISERKLKIKDEIDLPRPVCFAF